METLIESFGTIIKEIRKEQKMTQKCFRMIFVHKVY